MKNVMKTEKFQEELDKMLAETKKALTLEENAKDSPEEKKEKTKKNDAAAKIMAEFSTKLTTARTDLETKGKAGVFESADVAAFEKAFNAAAATAIKAGKEIGQPTWGQLLTSIFTKFALVVGMILTLPISAPTMLYKPARDFVGNVMTAAPHTATSAGLQTGLVGNMNALFEPAKTPEAKPEVKPEAAKGNPEAENVAPEAANGNPEAENAAPVVEPVVPVVANGNPAPVVEPVAPVVEEEEKKEVTTLGM